MSNYIAETNGAHVRLTDMKRSQAHDLPPRMALEISGSLRRAAATNPAGLPVRVALKSTYSLIDGAERWFMGTAEEARALADALDFAARRVMKAYPQRESAD